MTYTLNTLPWLAKTRRAWQISHHYMAMTWRRGAVPPGAEACRKRSSSAKHEASREVAVIGRRGSVAALPRASR